MKITAIIVTLNEEHNIKDCILSCQKVCEEVIVVDSCSIDQTVNIAEELGSKVIIQKYLGGGPQRNLGVIHARNDWILNIDADERVNTDMIADIKRLDLSKSTFDGYAFRRKSYIGNRWQKMWYPDYVTRLYNKNKTSFCNSIGHSKVQSEKIKKLDSHILHYSYKDLLHIVQKLTFFTSNGSKMLYNKNKKVTVFTPIFRAIFAFFKHYILKKGFLNGIDGLTISVYNSFTTYMKYAIVLETYNREKYEK